MKLYFSKGACSLTVRIIINELGLSCDYETVDLKTKKTAGGNNFLEVNPKGAVPTLMTNDGDTLTENAVILQYLADTSKADTLLPPVGKFSRYQVLEWLNYVATEMHKTVGQLFNPNLPEQTKQSLTIPLIKSKLNYINQHLKQHTYLLGEHFTLPDAYMFVILRWAQAFQFDFKEWPNIKRYFDLLLQRDSVKKSLDEEGIRQQPSGAQCAI